LKIFPKTRESQQRAAGYGYKATTEHTANSKSTRCIYLAWGRRRRQRSEVRWNFECVTTRFSLPPARPEAVVFVIKIFHDLLEDSSTDSLPLFRPALWPSLSLAPLLLTLSNSMLTNWALAGEFECQRTKDEDLPLGQQKADTVGQKLHFSMKKYSFAHCEP